MTKKNTKNILLEIGTEELPSSYIDPALRQIEKFTSKTLDGFGLRYNSLKTYATPVRLVLIISDIIIKSKDKTEEFLGPSYAKKNNKNYNKKAIECFAFKHGVVPEKLKIKTITNKGEYFFYAKRTKGEKTEKLLIKIFPDIIRNISFPKTMVWEESGFRFARPIRNIVALYGNKIIKFKIAGINSSNSTFGLHTCNRNKIKINSPENYLSTMKDNFIIVDQHKRRKLIIQSIQSVSKNTGNALFDEDLVNDINYLVEYPSAILCNFDSKYLNLPLEILNICIKKAQKCFVLQNDKNNTTLNYFICIRNGTPQYQEVVKEGYEKVITSRLDDATFFYNNDLQKGLYQNIEKLKGIIFHDKLGTIYEKLERIKQIAVFFNKEFHMNIDNIILEKAIMLSKADLVSEVVFEYPELQGTIGKIYARKLNEDENIAISIEQHYWPLNGSGQLPSNVMAFLISFADKIDTLVSSFSIGLKPSGSTDPYGLRRIGMGFIRMIKEKFPDKDLQYIVEKTFSFLPKNIKNNFQNTNEELLNFLQQRIENIFEVEGYSLDEIKAVTNILRKHGHTSMSILQLKLNALQNARKKSNFQDIVTMFKRITNIINQAKKQNVYISQTINEELLIEKSEKALYVFSKNIKIKIDVYISKKMYENVFDKIIEIKPFIDNFFEKVTIMEKNELIKSNRISIIKYIDDIFTEFINFSCLYS
ncbi:MAG: glycine--tRNA ligase subunit beta [Endomicrobium sp.]|jgi:glycyl-tRNA synthetase beta chain|nr:glycine--tRNA ligase subunit beta [Endomicrobium sp.]